MSYVGYMSYMTKYLNTWYDRLISYIPEPIKSLQVVFKIKLQVFLGKTHLNKPYMGEERNKVNQKHKNNLQKK